MWFILPSQHGQTKEIWHEARWVKSKQQGRPNGIPGGTIMGINPKLSRKIVKTYELESDSGWFTGVLLLATGKPSSIRLPVVFDIFTLAALNTRLNTLGRPQ
jgi:hypothetical protein